MQLSNSNIISMLLILSLSSQSYTLAASGLVTLLQFYRFPLDLLVCLLHVCLSWPKCMLYETIHYEPLWLNGQPLSSETNQFVHMNQFFVVYVCICHLEHGLTCIYFFLRLYGNMGYHMFRLIWLILSIITVAFCFTESPTLDYWILFIASSKFSVGISLFIYVEYVELLLLVQKNKFCL